MAKNKKLGITDKELVNIKSLLLKIRKGLLRFGTLANIYFYMVLLKNFLIKTFLSLHLALKEVLKASTEQQRVYIVRSLLRINKRHWFLILAMKKTNHFYIK